MRKLKTFARDLASRLGIEIAHTAGVPYISRGRRYTTVRPLAPYSPWNLDIEFQELFASVQGSTLVDVYRCFDLWKLVEQTSKHKRGSLIEVGVWRGGTGALIAKQSRALDIKERVYLCDTFAGVVKAGELDSTYEGGEHADTSRKVVDDLLQRLELDNVTILEGVFPDQTGPEIEDLDFRFSHIDVDVYRSARDCFDWIWPRTVRGGVVVFDDYGFKGCDGITRYVEEQMSLKDGIIMHNLNGHAVMVKL